MNRYLASLFISLLFTSNVWAAPKYVLAGKVIGPTTADTVLLISKSGVTRTVIVDSKFKLPNVSASSLKGARLYFFKGGVPVGPAVLKEVSSSKYLTFSGSAPSRVKQLSLTFTPKSGYMLARSNVDPKWVSKAKVLSSSFAGASLGFLSTSAQSVRARSVRISSLSDDPSVDSDTDGVPDILDVDDDNDGITDDRDTGGGSMISTMFLGFRDTINAHLGNLNTETINSTLSATGVFGLTFFINLSRDLLSATGGHVVCGASQLICRSAADGGTTSYYSGVSESDPSVQNQVWSNFNADRSGKPNLEFIRMGSDGVLVAAIQPRTADFSAGEILTANITNGAAILGTRIFSVLPPIISVPMLSSYDLGAGLTSVNYADPATPGSGPSNPIVLTGSTASFNFYPPQRKAIVGAEPDGGFRDIGNSRLGVILGGAGISSEFTCAGLYSELSAGLTEVSTSISMPGGNATTHTGAIGWPIVDSSPDTTSASGAVKSLKVDLSACLRRGGSVPGVYMASLTYAGSDTNFGAPRSAQNIWVSIP